MRKWKMRKHTTSVTVNCVHDIMKIHFVWEFEYTLLLGWGVPLG